MDSFEATIDIIGVNPFVFVPESILENIFHQANKNKGFIPVRLVINGHKHLQTLVKFSGDWRLYINTPMLKMANKNVGEIIHVQIEFDPVERVIPMHPKLKTALARNKSANDIFERLSPSRQKEIVRYIHSLKTEAAVEKNIEIAIQFLLGNASFVGRKKP
jgi:Uncharacterized protein conserved in bacteria